MIKERRKKCIEFFISCSGCTAADKQAGWMNDQPAGTERELKEGGSDEKDCNGNTERSDSDDAVIHNSASYMVVWSLTDRR